MLPSELLMYRFDGEAIIPKHLPLRPSNLAMATELIALFKAAAGGAEELSTAVQSLMEHVGRTSPVQVKPPWALSAVGK